MRVLHGNQIELRAIPHTLRSRRQSGDTRWAVVCSRVMMGTFYNKLV